MTPSRTNYQTRTNLASNGEHVTCRCKNIFRVNYFIPSHELKHSSVIIHFQYTLKCFQPITSSIKLINQDFWVWALEIGILTSSPGDSETRRFASLLQDFRRGCSGSNAHKKHSCRITGVKGGGNYLDTPCNHSHKQTLAGPLTSSVQDIYEEVMGSNHGTDCFQSSSWKYTSSLSPLILLDGADVSQKNV